MAEMWGRRGAMVRGTVMTVEEGRDSHRYWNGTPPGPA